VRSPPQLPHGLPPFAPDLLADVEERFLRDPEWLPLHDKDAAFEKFRRAVKRDTRLDALLHCQVSPLHSSLSVVRNPTTGELLDFAEVLLEDTGLSCKNSLSLLRPPGPPGQSLRGSTTNYPFLPGGMDEPSLEQIKTKTQKEEDIDFENDVKPPTGQLSLLSLLSGFDDIIDARPEREGGER
uniref:Ski2 N-terminal domain-containing protein n=1 Tax=Lepisosteus oculatus TaxID=7918 RepID=W5LVP8_LEPOC